MEHNHEIKVKIVGYLRYYLELGRLGPLCEAFGDFINNVRQLVAEAVGSIS